MQSVAAAILAGGKASRMGGRPKSFLEVGGARIIDRQLAVLRPMFEEILLSANDPEPFVAFGLPVVSDDQEGPLSGILAILRAARAEYVVVVACDMPYLSAQALLAIADPALGADKVVPIVGGRPEPLCARYSKRLIPAISAQLVAGDRKVSHLLQTGVCWLDEGHFPDTRFLTNCNAPGDL